MCFIQHLHQSPCNIIYHQDLSAKILSSKSVLTLYFNNQLDVFPSYQNKRQNTYMNHLSDLSYTLLPCTQIPGQRINIQLGSRTRNLYVQCSCHQQQNLQESAPVYLSFGGECRKTWVENKYYTDMIQTWKKNLCCDRSSQATALDINNTI